MTLTLIITLCVLLLIAYVFDLTASKTRIPSVILLLLLGWILRQIAGSIEFTLPDLSPALPTLGTVGLILIVLEGSLELELHKSKAPLILKSFFTALLPMLALAFGLAYAFQLFGAGSFKANLVNAIPLCVISSAIAIPSVRGLSRHNKEFVIYESSLSDIIGVLLFNFISLNDSFGLPVFGHFSLQLFIIIVVSFVATVGLAFLLNRIDHHIKFVPIILLIILIYYVSKVYHLPGLIFILFFGLFIGNLDEMKGIRWIQRLNPEALNKEVHKFKDLVGEAAFLIRSLFFILFGFLMETRELLDVDSLAWSLGTVAAIFGLRALQLKVFRLPLSPLVFIAPRGLITILLFLSIDPVHSIALVNKSYVIQVIVLSALVMMTGLVTNRRPDKENT